MKTKPARTATRQDALSPMPAVAEPALAEMAMRFSDDNMARRLQAGAPSRRPAPSAERRPTQP